MRTVRPADRLFLALAALALGACAAPPSPVAPPAQEKAAPAAPVALPASAEPAAPVPPEGTPKPTVMDDAQREAERKVIVDGIRRVSPIAFELTEGAHDLLFPWSVRSARSVIDGNAKGLKLFGGRADGSALAAAIGLEEGDRVLSVGNRPVDAPKGATGGAKVLRFQNVVTIDVERAGKPTQLTYRVLRR
jgi:hypothetical protein